MTSVNKIRSPQAIHGCPQTSVPRVRVVSRRLVCASSLWDQMHKRGTLTISIVLSPLTSRQPSCQLGSALVCIYLSLLFPPLLNSFRVSGDQRSSTATLPKFSLLHPPSLCRRTTPSSPTITTPCHPLTHPIPQSSCISPFHMSYGKSRDTYDLTYTHPLYEKHCHRISRQNDGGEVAEHLAVRSGKFLEFSYYIPKAHCNRLPPERDGPTFLLS
jgi:hypothetical protein